MVTPFRINNATADLGASDEMWACADTSSCRTLQDWIKCRLVERIPARSAAPSALGSYA